MADYSEVCPIFTIPVTEISGDKTRQFVDGMSRNLWGTMTIEIHGVTITRKVYVQEIWAHTREQLCTFGILIE